MTHFTSRQLRIYWMGLLVLAGLAICSGCSGRKNTTIKGKVTYQGAPVSVGAIYFHGSNDQVAMGNLDSDGRFTATDVPLGEVRVSLQVRDPGVYGQGMMGAPGGAAKNQEGPPRVTSIPVKYADPNSSGLKYSIDSTTKEIEVKLD